MPLSLDSQRIAGRGHYENAFEACVRAAGVAFVAVSDVRASIRGRLGVKAFDYIVYPEGRSACLVDVKGRRFAVRPGKRRRRWECWVTRADVEGLRRWQELFGPEFTAAFVFGYWLLGQETPRAMDPDFFTFGGRVYTFWGVTLADYVQHHRERSPKWKTIDLTTEQFIRLAWPLARWGRETVDNATVEHERR